MGTWLNTQKSVTSWSTGSGDAVLVSLSELRWKNKVFYAALLYQFPNMEMIKVHPPDMEASSRILNMLFPFYFLRESKSSLPHVQELTFSGKEVIRDLSSFNDPGPTFSCNIFSWLFRINHDIGKLYSKITQCKALWLSPFSLVCPPFTDYSIVGHNVLPALNSTVSCRWQTLRQKENKFVLVDAHGLHVFQWYHLISTIEYTHGPHVFQ